MKRRSFNIAASLGLLSPMVSSLAQGHAEFPSRPLAIVVPYAPGGVVDICTRVVADQMSQDLPQRVLVDNRSGADGRVGMERVLKAPADGYTLLAASPLLAVGQHLGDDFSFKTSDFAGIGAIASPPAIFVVPSSLPVRTLKELVAWAKSKPGQLNVPHPGRGSSIHLAQELFFQVAGIRVNSIPYKGQPPALIDMAAGNLSFGLFHQSVVLSQIKSGRLRAVATNAEHRTHNLPDVPTLAEEGYPDTVVQAWTGLAVRASTPAPLAQYLSEAMKKAMGMPSVRARLQTMDVEILDQDGPAFTALVERDSERFGRLIRARNLKG